MTLHVGVRTVGLDQKDLDSGAVPHRSESISVKQKGKPMENIMTSCKFNPILRGLPGAFGLAALLLTLAFGFWSASASAATCANDGAAVSIAPDDSNEGGNLACGDGAVAGDQSSTAIGSFATANNIGTSLGSNATATAFRSTALGNNASAIGPESLSLGRSAFAAGNLSIAVGAYADAEATNATAVGPFAEAAMEHTMVLGSVPGVNGGNSYVDVGMGTTMPLAPLHVRRDDGTASLLIEESSLSVAPRTLMMLSNPGNTKFEISNVDAGVSWAFTNSGADFRVSRQGSGVIEFRVDNDGNAFVAGDLTLGGSLMELSDRKAKHAISPVNGDAILNKVAAIEISEWSYLGQADDQRHIGPMAQDFGAAFGLAGEGKRISARDMAGVNMAAIGALVARNQALERRISQLERALHQAGN